MFQGEFAAVGQAAAGKVAVVRENWSRYLLASVLAGFYIGLGILAMSTSGGVLTVSGHPLAKFANAFVFPAALSLVVFAGAELFTGNVFVMTAGLVGRTVHGRDALPVLLLSYLGNLFGSLLCAGLFAATGLLSGGTAAFIQSTAEAKVSLSAVALLSRGIFCNSLVCLAVWCCTRMKSESGKLILIFWCIFVFVLCGFEHSIANMTLLALALLTPHGPVLSLSGAIYNLFFVTVGNILGGALFVGGAYAYLGRAGRH